jgi:hypothetical protein
MTRKILKVFFRNPFSIFGVNVQSFFEIGGQEFLGFSDTKTGIVEALSAMRSHLWAEPTPPFSGILFLSQSLTRVVIRSGFGISVTFSPRALSKWLTLAMIIGDL